MADAVAAYNGPCPFGSLGAIHRFCGRTDTAEVTLFRAIIPARERPLPTPPLQRPEVSCEPIFIEFLPVQCPMAVMLPA